LLHLADPSKDCRFVFPPGGPIFEFTHASISRRSSA
jgi:hypothetical protein